MPKRDVPKETVCPDLTGMQLDIVENICFAEFLPDAIEADILFIFGSTTCQEQLVEVVNNLDLNNFKHIIVTGARPFDSDTDTQSSEAEQIYSAMKNAGDIPVTLEQSSTSSLENVANSAKFIQSTGAKSLAFITKEHLLGRCYASLMKYFPRLTYSVVRGNTMTLPGFHVKRQIWRTDALQRNRVWPEIERLRLYGDRGDIDTSMFVRDLAKLP